MTEGRDDTIDTLSARPPLKRISGAVIVDLDAFHSPCSSSSARSGRVCLEKPTHDSQQSEVVTQANISIIKLQVLTDASNGDKLEDTRTMDK